MWNSIFCFDYWLIRLIDDWIFGLVSQVSFDLIWTENKSGKKSPWIMWMFYDEAYYCSSSSSWLYWRHRSSLCSYRCRHRLCLCLVCVCVCVLVYYISCIKKLFKDMMMMNIYTNTTNENINRQQTRLIFEKFWTWFFFQFYCN